MMGIWCILKNNFFRALSKKNYIIMTIVVTFVSILTAIYFTSKFEIKGNIAFVTQASHTNIKSKYINVTILKKEPPESKLLLNKYDAVVIDNGNGTFSINTLKDKEFKEKLQQLIKNPKLESFEDRDKRGVGANILGYLLMFILLEGMLYMSFFTEDKESGTFKRTVTSPLSIKIYLLTNCIFDFFIIYIPALAALFIEKELLKVNIGFTYFQYSYLIAIMAMLSVEFALFMASIIEKLDSGMTMASSIILITSIISGSFYSFSNKNIIIKKLVNILPQSNYLKIVQGLEHGHKLMDYWSQLAGLMIFILILFFIGVLVCKKRFSEGRY